MRHSVEVDRYSKYIIDNGSKNMAVTSQQSVFNLNRKKDLEQLTSGDIGKNILMQENDAGDYGLEINVKQSAQTEVKDPKGLIPPKTERLSHQ